MRVLFSSVFMMLLLSVIVDSVNARMKTPYTRNIRRRDLKSKGKKKSGGGGGGGGGGGLPQAACTGELKFTELEKMYVCELVPLDVAFLLDYIDKLEYSLTEGKELYLFAYCGGELESVAEDFIEMLEEIVETVKEIIPFAETYQNNPDNLVALNDALDLFQEGGDIWLSAVDLINPLLSAANLIEVSAPGTGRTKCD